MFASPYFLMTNSAKTYNSLMTNACPSMQTVLDPRIKTRVAGVVLTSPAVGVEPSHPILKVRILFYILVLDLNVISGQKKKETKRVKFIA